MKKIICLLPLILLLSVCKKKDPPAPAPSGGGGGGPVKYSVIYKGNGNTGGTAPVDANAYDNGGTAEVLANTDLERTGYTFFGWNTLSTGVGTDYAPGSTVTITDNLTLYAKWWDNTVPVKYKITYNGNGNTSGSAPYDTTSYAPGSTFYVQGNSGALQKSGATFKNWNTQSGGGGVSYNPGASGQIYTNLTLYAVYTATTAPPPGKFVGFNASGQVKTKSSYTSSWSTQDLDNTFGSSLLVTVLWDGSKYVGFNASGQVKTKSSLTSAWMSQDLNNTFGSSTLTAVLWDGSKYVGFNSSGQVKTKSSYTSSWISQDLNNTFGSSLLVAVTWDGSKYVGFNASGQVKTKSSLTSSWISQDLSNTFGSSLVVATAWDGTKYAGFNASGQLKTKSSYTSSWSTQDLDNTFGSSNLVTVVYH
jgi:uncharacterized repeat protein (TIGR02543 family)